jgi:hypothetical protein
MSLSDRLARHAIGTANELEDDLLEAATAIDTQAAEIARLRAALDEAVGVMRPFANAWAECAAKTPNHMPMQQDLARFVMSTDFRAARDFITKHSGGERG